MRPSRASRQRWIDLSLGLLVLLAGCTGQQETPEPEPSEFARFVGTWTDGPQPSYHPGIPISDPSTNAGTWVRIEEDGGVRLGSSYEVVTAYAQSVYDYADERGGRLILSGPTPRIVWDWEDVYEYQKSSRYDACFSANVKEIRWSPEHPDASVPDQPPQVISLGDGGTSLVLRIGLSYGTTPLVAGPFVRVKDIGPERQTGIQEVAGVWSNGLYADFSFDGGSGSLPWGDQWCTQSIAALTILADGGATLKTLTYQLSSPEVSTYILEVASGEIGFDGRRLFLRKISFTSEEFEAYPDAGRRFIGTDAGRLEDREERAWFVPDGGFFGLDGFWISDLPRFPLSR